MQKILEKSTAKKILKLWKIVLKHGAEINKKVRL